MPKIHLPEITNYGTCSYQRRQQSGAVSNSSGNNNYVLTGGKATINSTSIKSSRPRSKREPTAAPRESRVPASLLHGCLSAPTGCTFIWQLSWQISRQQILSTCDAVTHRELLIMLLPASSPSSGLLPFACASYFKAVNTFQPNRKKKCTTSPTEPQLWQKYSWHKFCTCLGASSTSCARVVILFSCACSGWVWCYDICLLRNKAPH